VEERLLVSDDQAPWADIDIALREQRAVDAIRLYRLATGTGIGPAVQRIEARKRELGVARAPAPAAPSNVLPGVLLGPGMGAAEQTRVAQFEASAFRPAGVLLAAWRSARGEVCVLHRRDGRQLQLDVLPDSGNYGHDLHGYSIIADGLHALTAAGGNPDQAEIGNDPQFRAALREILVPAVQAVQGLASRSMLIALDAAVFEAGFAYRSGGVLQAADWQAIADRARALPALAEELAACTPATGDVPLDPARARLILSLCLAECTRAVHLFNFERHFADLDVRHAEALVPLARETLGMYRRLAGAAALPDWMEIAARDGHRSGLLEPGAVRWLAPRIGTLLAGIPGAAAEAGPVTILIGEAAAAGNWLMGLEPAS